MLGVAVALLFVVNGSIAQPKTIKKIEKRYQGGAYKSAYQQSNKLVIKSDDTYNGKISKINGYLYKALAAEAIYKYTLIDTLINQAKAVLNTIPADSFQAYARTYMLLAKVYQESNQLSKALELADMAVEKAELIATNNELPLSQALITKAKVQSKAGFYNEALASLQRADVLLTPKTSKKGDIKKSEFNSVKSEYASLLNLRAQVWFNRGNYSKVDSALPLNRAWIKSKLGKRNFYFRDHLVNQGYYAKFNYDLKKATKYFEDANKYTKFRPMEKTGQDVQEQLIDIYYTRNKKHESIVQRIKFERKARYSFGKNSLAYARYRLQEVRQLYTDSRYDRADKKLNQIYRTKTNFYDNHTLRFDMLDMKVKIATRRSNFDVAIDSLQKLVALKKVYYGGQSPEYHKEMLRLAEYYMNYSNNFTAARSIQDKSFNQILSQQLAPQNKQYISYLQQIAALNELTEKYDLAVKYLEDAAKIIKTHYGTDNVDYARDLEKMASALLKKGEFSKAEEAIKQAVSIFQNTSSRTSALDKSATYLTLAKLYTTLGLYEEAEDALSKASKLSRKANKSSSAKSSDELAELYIRQGRYNEAEDVLKTYLQTKESKFGKESKELIPTLNGLGNLYIILGNYSDAEKNIRRSMAISGKIFTENSVKYAEALRLMENLYKELGDFKKADETAVQVLNILRNQLGKNHIDVAAALTRLSQIKLFTEGDVKESEKLLYEALAIVKFNLGDNNPTYAEQLKSLAILFIESKRLDKADSVLNVANGIWVSKLGKKNVNSAEIAMLKGDIAFRSKNFQNAQQRYAEARSTYSAVFSQKHPGYVKATSKLSRALYAVGNYNASLKLLNESTANYLEFTKKYFPSLSFSEKQKYWNQIKEDFEFYNSLAFKVYDKNPAIAGNMFNNIMATKALLLSSSIKVKERILNSKDEKLITKYNEWTSKKQLLISAVAMSKEAQQQAGLDPAKLEKEINALEKELSESSELFAQNNEKSNPNWQQLKAALKPNEYAIEMMRFRFFDKGFTDSIVYAALIVSKNTKKAPDVVVMDNGKKLETRFLKYYKNVVINKLDEDNYSYDVYWKPIKKFIPDGAIVYFSAEGVYNEISLESLQAQNDEFAIDKNDFVNISNTKDIIAARTVVKSKSKDKEAEPVKESGALAASKAVLFGNPTFYAAAKATNSGKADDRAMAKQNVYASAAQNVIAQLPGTEIEVNEIEKLFVSKGWKLNKYLLNNAEEDSIKMIRSPKILHIATHGYFNPDEERSTEELSATEAEFASNPLLRSGLLLKGAGDVLKSNNSLKINSENGVLTAYEAMDLNLDNTDLVVLSACETGKGEVQIGEGVFGLQRAILVAGAKTMVMTLFKVNDDITKELMITFYKRWLETGELRASFTEAKRFIKSKYKYPVYWGSFVMVGLDK